MALIHSVKALIPKGPGVLLLKIASKQPFWKQAK
jgi:hypothetical protein